MQKSFFFSLSFFLLVIHNVSAASPDKKYLIIHADDAGMSHSVNRATVDAMNEGLVSSASIMVPCPWFSEFAAHARQHADRDYGIHLTLNSEWKHYRWGPVAPREKVPSLIDQNGYLWDDVRQVAQHVKAEEAAIELRAQVERAQHFGVPLSHLDTHMGALISRPDLMTVYVNLGLEYDLPILFIRETDAQLARQYPALAERGQAMRQLLVANNMPLLDHIGQFYGGDTHQARREAYTQFLRELQPGVSQLIIHCGYDDAELRAITSSASRRDGDRRIFTDPDISALVEDLGIEVITWKQFRQLGPR
jgi:predicted glycoside hydrolase/deacetylase ChbG (UPF0249 family)